MLNGQGSLLVITKDGNGLVKKLADAGVAAGVIGNTIHTKDRKVIIDGEERFLVPPKGDALNVVFYGQPLPV